MAKNVVCFILVVLCDITRAVVETHSLKTLSCPLQDNVPGTPQLNTFKSLNTKAKDNWKEYSRLLTKSKTYQLYKNLSDDEDINPFLQKKPKPNRLEYCLIASIRYLDWIREAEESLLTQGKLRTQDLTSSKESFLKSSHDLCAIGRLAETVNKSTAPANVSLEISDIKTDIRLNLVKVLKIKESISSFVKCLARKTRRLKGNHLTKKTLEQLGKCKWGRHRCSKSGRRKRKNKGKTRKNKAKKKVRRKGKKARKSRKTKNKNGRPRKEKTNKNGRNKAGNKKKNSKPRNEKKNGKK